MPAPTKSSSTEPALVSVLLPWRLKTLVYLALLLGGWFADLTLVILIADIFEDLKNVLYTDSAVAGEAAGIAMGLLMLGSASDQALEDMLAYAHDTQHEKIIRGLAIGIALVMCGREEEADTLIEQLTLDKVPPNPSPFTH